MNRQYNNSRRRNFQHINSAKKSFHWEIIPKQNEDFDKVLKAVRRKTKKSGIVDIIKDRSYYKKPSIKKKEKRRQREIAIKRYQKECQEVEYSSSAFDR